MMTKRKIESFLSPLSLWPYAGCQRRRVAIHARCDSGCGGDRNDRFRTTAAGVNVSTRDSLRRGIHATRPATSISQTARKSIRIHVNGGFLYFNKSVPIEDSGQFASLVKPAAVAHLYFRTARCEYRRQVSSHLERRSTRFESRPEPVCDLRRVFCFQVMPSAKTQPARGMRDFLPEDVRKREYVIGVIKEVYERYGFEPLETPAVRISKR